MVAGLAGRGEGGRGVGGGGGRGWSVLVGDCAEGAEHGGEMRVLGVF